MILDHIGATVADFAKSRAFCAAALAPGLRPHYHPNHHGAFVLDPDGHNIEAVCHAPA
jgi:catechol 2,3-dioxygenase-like lactoylglutathione lyase family enzyme